MMTPEQARQLLQELLAPHALGFTTAVIEDRTGLLGPAVAEGLLAVVAGQAWFAIRAEAGVALSVRRALWQRHPARVALIVQTGSSLPGLRDLTHGAAFIGAGASALLRVLAELSLPDDSRLDPLAGSLLEQTAGLDILRAHTISRAMLPCGIVAALLTEDLFQAPSAPLVLARLLHSTTAIPEAAHPLCQEYAATLPGAYEALVAGLLTFGQPRARVAQGLLDASTSMREGQVSSDPLVTDFLNHAAVNEVVVLDAFAQCIEEALLAEPEWGRELVQGLPERRSTVTSRILPGILEADLQRQLADLLGGQRTTVDDRLWREHLFCTEYGPWMAALNRLAALVQLRAEMQRLLDGTQSLPGLVQAFAERVSAGDLAWVELGELAKQADALSAGIGQLRKEYQQWRTALNGAFAQLYATQYPYLFGGGAIPLVVHLVSRQIKPRLDSGEHVLVIIVDGLSYPLWQRFRSDLAVSGWQAAEGYALALLPTVTAVSRYALFSGPVKDQIYPSLAEPDDEAPAEDEFRALKVAVPGRKVAVYKKRDLRSSLDTVTTAIRGTEFELVVVVINEVDDLIRSPVHTPFPLQLQGYPFLNSVLKAAKGSKRAVLLVADHGFTPDGDRKWPVPPAAKVVESRLAKGNQSPPEVPAVVCDELVLNVGGPFLALYDFGGRFSAQPKVGYHSGIGLEEAVVPAVWLRAGTAAPTFGLRFVDVPGEVTEDEDLLVTIELRAQGRLPAGVGVEVWLPGMARQAFAVDAAAGLPFHRRQIAWKPTLPAREPAEEQTMRLRAICTVDRTEAAHAEAEVTVQPRRGKYESAVAALLP